MLKLSPEAKVGGVSLIALIMLAAIILHLGNFRFTNKGYHLQGVFAHVNGLKPGNTIRYAGVQVGKVLKVQPTSDGVMVDLEIQDGIQIPQESKFSIGAEGLLGEKYVEIVPPNKRTGFLHPNDTVQGEYPKGLEQFLSRSDEVLRDIQQMVRNLNDIVGDEQFRNSVKISADNIQNITRNLAAFSEKLDNLLAYSESDFHATVANLRAMSDSLRQTADQVNTMVGKVNDDGRTADDIKALIQSLKRSSEKIETIATRLADEGTSPENMKAVKETLRNAREVSQKANTTLTKLSAIRTEVDVSVGVNPAKGHYKSDAAVRFSNSDNGFLLAGLSAVGDGDKLNLQIGKNTSHRTTQRVGIMDGKAGLGYDVMFGPKLTLSMDLYDPNQIKAKLRSQYKLGTDMYFILQNDSLFKQAEQNFYMGMKYRM